MKKALSLLFATLLLCGVLTGCDFDELISEYESIPESHVSQTTPVTTEKPTAVTTTTVTTTTEKTAVTTVTTTKPTTQKSTNVKPTVTTRKPTTTITTVRTKQETIYQEPQGDMVWIPQTGSKYHSHAGCSGTKSPAHVSRQKAIELGFTPCKRCY